MKSAISKHNWNVDRLVEHIRANVVWELSWELWVEGNVKWLLKVSSEWWREAAGRYKNTTGDLTANIDVSICRWLHIIYINQNP